VSEDGRVVDGEEWQEKVCNREDWKKLQKMASDRRILHMAMERIPVEILAYCNHFKCKHLINVTCNITQYHSILLF
jgi:hypothetical protein